MNKHNRTRYITQFQNISIVNILSNILNVLSQIQVFVKESLWNIFHSLTVHKLYHKAFFKFGTFRETVSSFVLSL